MKHFIYLSVIVIIICLMPVLLFAQTNPPPDTTDVPIDGGLSLLLAAGVGYGVKKGYKRKKERVNKSS